MDSRTPQVVDQFEYPRLPTDWRGGNPAAVVDVAAGNGRMTPWTVESPVQLVRGTAPGQGGMGLQGYHLGLGGSGSLERMLTGLDPGREYRVSLRYARDSRSAGAGRRDGRAVGRRPEHDADRATRTCRRRTPFGTYVGTFTAAARPQTLSLVGHRRGRHDDRRPRRHRRGPGRRRRPGPLRVRGGRGRQRPPTPAPTVGRCGDPDRHHRLVARRRPRRARSTCPAAPTPTPWTCRTTCCRARPTSPPRSGCARTRRQLDRAVPPRRRARRRRQLLPDPDADAGPGQHRPGGHLQGEGQRPPGARLRRRRPRTWSPTSGTTSRSPAQGTTGTLYLNGVADRDARQPDDRHGRRRPDGEQLAGPQRLPRPGVRRPDGRRPHLHLDADRGRHRGDVRRGRRAAHDHDRRGRRRPRRRRSASR